MNGNNTAALGGFIAAAGASLITTQRSYRTLARRAEDRAEDANSAAQAARYQVELLADSGDLVRLGADPVSDLLTGLAYPGQSPAPPPNAFAAIPAALQRPVLSEALARAVTPWPGRTNLYDAQGRLVHPEQAYEGQNFALGLALGFPEVRALLLGLPQDKDAAPDVVAQYYRLAHGFAKVVQEMFGQTSNYPTGLSQAQYDEAWRRLLFGSPQGGGVWTRLAAVLEAGDIITNTADETIMGQLELPANSLLVGDRLDLEYYASVLGAAADEDFTYRVRLDALNGPILLRTTVSGGVSGNLAAFLKGTGMVRKVGTLGYIVWGGFGLLEGGSTSLLPTPSAIDTTVAHQLILTVEEDSASASNQTRMEYGDLLRFRP